MTNLALASVLSLIPNGVRIAGQNIIVNITTNGNVNKQQNGGWRPKSDNKYNHGKYLSMQRILPRFFALVRCFAIFVVRIDSRDEKLNRTEKKTTDPCDCDHQAFVRV